MILEGDIEEPGDIAPATSNEDGANQETDDSPDISQHEEAAAKARGWKPKDEYRGRESDWVDAKGFLDRNASLKSEVEELRERVAAQEETYAQRLKRIEAANERIIQVDRERLIRELRQAKRAAAEIGDLGEFDRLETEEDKYYARIAQDERREREQEQPQPKAPDLLPETQDWIRRNSWFNESKAMQAIALGFYEEANEGMPSARDEGRRLAYVDRKMAEVYPQKFGNANRSNSVEGGNRGMSAPKTVNLTQEERAACRRFIAKGIIKDEAEYKRYLDEYGT